ncbi:hypothetical protein BH09MYX1_BH09MYX1_47300 [soil metagenome]
MIAALVRLFGPFRAPPDDVAWAAVVCACIALLVAWRGPKALAGGTTWKFLALAAAVSAFLSLGYAGYYLRGGPRIIDATSYWLQGRALSEGWVSFPIPDPAASFRGRFLLGAEPEHLAGIFPPGYPLLLAVGFAIDAPMLIGPLLAAGLVVATHRLARELSDGVPSLDEGTRETAARGAALFSIACATLRYHTADTMAHGAVALLVTFALAAALRARREGGPRGATFFFVGLLVGYVGLTRPFSALPIGAVALYLLGTSELQSRLRALVALVLGVVPAIAILLLVQRAATGSLFTPTQSAYYAASDGPPGCFRYGFGDGIGCLYEHGDFVHARLEHGYGLAAALGTTARRLHAHLDDAFTAWPLTFAICMYFAINARKLPRVLALPAALVGLQILAYVPFYFDGDYPGGGARFFADVIPVEHAIVAVGIATIAAAAAKRGGAALHAGRRVFAVLALIGVLFATHTVFAHRSLSERDGGAPMWDAERAKDAGAERGLVFVDTDHAFNLAFDPAAAKKRTRVIARLTGDDHERLLYDRLGAPPTFLYHWADGKPSIGGWVPSTARNAYGVESWRFEGEAMWPPFVQHGGFAIPEWRTHGNGSCASGGRVLVFRPSDAAASVTLELPIPREGRWALLPRIVFLSDTPMVGKLTARRGAETVAEWTWSDVGNGACVDLDATLFEATGSAPLMLILETGIESKGGGAGRSSGGTVSLDRVLVERR